MSPTDSSSGKVPRRSSSALSVVSVKTPGEPPSIVQLRVPSSNCQDMLRWLAWASLKMCCNGLIVWFLTGIG